MQAGIRRVTYVPLLLLLDPWTPPKKILSTPGKKGTSLIKKETSLIKKRT